jgi:plastocyanin
MKAAVVAISAGVLAISLALPALLFAQDPPPATPTEEPAPGADAPPPPTDPIDPATGEPTTPAETTPEVSAGAEPTATPPVPKGSASVSMQDFSFSPASVTVNIGDSVTWSNTGAEDHDAAASSFSTGTVTPGSSATQTFSTAGTFSYVCSFHPQMKGTVQVVGGTDPGGGSTTDPGGTALPGSEAAAAAGADAAGSSSALPSTGQEAPPLLILGLGLVGCGAMAALLARWREREELS